VNIIGWAPVVAPVPLLALAYAIFRDWRLHKRKLVFRRWKGVRFDNEARTCRARLVNEGRAPMASEDLVQPIRLEIPTGKLVVASIELHQRGVKYPIPITPTNSEETWIEITGITLNSGDYVQFDLVIRNSRHLPDLSMQAKGFRLKFLNDVDD